MKKILLGCATVGLVFGMSTSFAGFTMNPQDIQKAADKIVPERMYCDKKYLKDLQYEGVAKMSGYEVDYITLCKNYKLALTKAATEKDMDRHYAACVGDAKAFLKDDGNEEADAKKACTLLSKPLKKSEPVNKSEPANK